MVQCKIRGNKGSGCEVTGGSELVLNDCEVYDNGKSGVYSQQFGEVTVMNSTIYRNSYAGEKFAPSSCNSLHY